MRESFEEGLLRMSIPQRKVTVRLRLKVLCWCTSETCNYSISAIVMATAMTSCSCAILGIERFTSAFARKVYEQMVALLQSRSLEFYHQNFKTCQFNETRFITCRLKSEHNYSGENARNMRVSWMML